MPIKDQFNPSMYPAGLVDAAVDFPAEGLTQPLLLSHHLELLNRQRLVPRAYPYKQGWTCGTFATTTMYGLFQAPPNCEAFQISFNHRAAQITAATVFTVTYNSTAKTLTEFPPTALNFVDPRHVILGPWALATATTDAPADLLVAFVIDTGTVDVYNLHARFSIKSL